MNHYSIAEKAFIAENHPNIILESYSFSSCINDIESGEAVLDESTFRDSGLKAVSEGTPSELFNLQLCFRDLNTRHPYHRIWYTGWAQFISDNENILLESVPEIVFDETADVDGRFSVTISFMCRDLTDEMLDDDAFRWLSDDTAKNNAMIAISGFHIANQFVDTCFDMLLNISDSDGEQENHKPVCTMKPIVYNLTPDWIVDQVMEICEEKTDEDHIVDLVTEGDVVIPTGEDENE